VGLGGAGTLRRTIHHPPTTRDTLLPRKRAPNGAQAGAVEERARTVTRVVAKLVADIAEAVQECSAIWSIVRT
jgi:hypothetical protein